MHQHTYPASLKNSALRVSFLCICIILYFLQTVNPQNAFVAQFKQLLDKYSNVDVKAMGFPENWEEELLWTDWADFVPLSYRLLIPLKTYRTSLVGSSRMTPQTPSAIPTPDAPSKPSPPPVQRYRRTTNYMTTPTLSAAERHTIFNATVSGPLSVPAGLKYTHSYYSSWRNSVLFIVH